VIKLDIINEVVTHRDHQDQGGARRRNRLREHEKALTNGDRIELRGFGVFNVRPRKTGIGRNPRTAPSFIPRASRSVQARQELQSID